MPRGRTNRTGIDWNDPDQAKAARRENARQYKARGNKKQSRPPVVIDGVTYESQAEAARALGVSNQYIWQRLHPDWRKAQRKRLYRKKNDPRPERQRWVKLSDADAATVARLLSHFPQCETFDALVAYAVRRLAEHTDD